MRKELQKLRLAYTRTQRGVALHHPLSRLPATESGWSPPVLSLSLFSLSEPNCCHSELCQGGGNCSDSGVRRGQAELGDTNRGKEVPTLGDRPIGRTEEQGRRNWKPEAEEGGEQKTGKAESYRGSEP